MVILVTIQFINVHLSILFVKLFFMEVVIFVISRIYIIFILSMSVKKYIGNFISFIIVDILLCFTNLINFCSSKKYDQRNILY